MFSVLRTLGAMIVLQARRFILSPQGRSAIRTAWETNPLTAARVITAVSRLGVSGANLNRVERAFSLAGGVLSVADLTAHVLSAYSGGDEERFRDNAKFAMNPNNHTALAMVSLDLAEQVSDDRIEEMLEQLKPVFQEGNSSNSDEISAGASLTLMTLVEPFVGVIQKAFEERDEEFELPSGEIDNGAWKWDDENSLTPAEVLFFTILFSKLNPSQFDSPFLDSEKVQINTAIANASRSEEDAVAGLSRILSKIDDLPANRTTDVLRDIADWMKDAI